MLDLLADDAGLHEVFHCDGLCGIKLSLLHNPGNVIQVDGVKLLFVSVQNNNTKQKQRGWGQPGDIGRGRRISMHTHLPSLPHSFTHSHTHTHVRVGEAVLGLCAIDGRLPTSKQEPCSTSGMLPGTFVPFPGGLSSS